MSEINQIELKALVGPHVLDAVDFDTAQFKDWHGDFEDSAVMRFRLDGVAYCVVEDPDDGFRSSMRHAYIATDDMKNTFPPVQVIGRWRTEGPYGDTDEVIEFINTDNGEIVLEAGTSAVDDYYPGFVAIFRPDAIGETA